MVQDLQHECLKRSVEVSSLVNALLARVRAEHKPPSAAATPPAASGSTAATTSTDEDETMTNAVTPGGDGEPDAVRRVLAEADEWLVGAESLAERASTHDPLGTAEAASGGDVGRATLQSELVELERTHAEALAELATQKSARTALEEEVQWLEQRLAEAMAETERRALATRELRELTDSDAVLQRLGGSTGERDSDDASWEPLWRPNAEAAIASAKQGETEARRELAELKRHVNEARLPAVETEDLASTNPGALREAASVASASFSTLCAAASSSDPNDPRNAIDGAAAGVEEAVESLRMLFVRWAPMLRLQCLRLGTDLDANSQGDGASSSDDGIIVDMPEARPVEKASVQP